MLDIKLVIKQQVPRKPARSEYCQPDLLQKVQECIRDVNSNLIDSEPQWRYLKALYNLLSKKKTLGPKHLEILEILEPEIMKHAEYDSVDAAELDGVNMHKYLK